jgi:hypothetical protein
VGEGPLPLGLAVDPVHVDEVDVRGEVELAGAELAHRERAEAGAGLAVGEAGGGAVLRPEPPVVEPDRRVEAGGGQGGELAGHLLHPRPAEVAERDPDELAGADAPEEPVEGGHVAGGEPARGADEEAAEIGLGPRPDERRRARGPAEEVRLAREELGHHARRAAEEDERLEEVRGGGELGRAVHEPLDAGQGEIGVRREPHRLAQGLDVGGEAARQAGEPLDRLARGGLGGREARDRVSRNHG